MVEFMIGLVVFMILAAVVWWVAGILELPEKIKQIVLVVLVLAFVVYALGVFGVIGGMGGGPRVIVR